MIEPVNLSEAFQKFSDTWSPKIVGRVNDFHVKLAKLDGEFVWHAHDQEDELFLVIKGNLRIRLRDGEVTVGPGEFVVVPHGVEHLPIADEECHVMLIEPATTLNTGNVESEHTVHDPEHLDGTR